MDRHFFKLPGISRHAVKKIRFRNPGCFYPTFFQGAPVWPTYPFPTRHPHPCRLRLPTKNCANPGGGKKIRESSVTPLRVVTTHEERKNCAKENILIPARAPARSHRCFFWFSTLGEGGA